MLVLLGVAVLGSALAGPWSPEFHDGGRVTVDVPLDPPTPEGPATPTVEPSPETVAEEPDVVVPAWLRPVLVTAALLAVALLVLHLARRLRLTDGVTPDLEREPAGPGVEGTRDRSPELHALREGVAAAARHLRSGARPVDAVVAAWVRLEQAAAASGLPRDPAATPTEFTLAVLDRTHADRAATRALLDLYLRARFGEEHLDADDVATARRAVDVIGAALARTAAGAAGADTAGSPPHESAGGDP